MKLTDILNYINKQINMKILGCPLPCIIEEITQYSLNTVNTEQTLCLIDVTKKIPKNSLGWFISVTTRVSIQPQDHNHIIINIKHEQDSAQIYTLIRELLNREHELYRIFHELYLLSNQHSHVTTFVNRINLLLEHPILVLNSHFSIVGQSDDFSPIEKIWTIDKNRYSLNESIRNNLKTQKFYKDLQTKKGTSYIFQTPEIDLVLAGIFVGHYLVGYICLITEHLAATQYEQKIATYVAELSGQNIYTIPVQQNLQGNQIGDYYFLSYLIHHNEAITDLEDFWDWKRYTNHLYYQLLICSLPESEHPQAKFHFYYFLQKLFPSSPILQMGDQCIVLLYADSKELLLLEKQLTRLKEQLTLLKQEAILSFPFYNLNEAAFYYKYCDLLLQELRPKQSFSLSTMEELYLTFLRMSYTNKETLHLLLHPDLKELMNYDKQHRSELYLTLNTYIECNRNILQMSQALHISKSTGFYRINQLKDILDNPFEDSQRLFCYECSLQLFKR